MGIEPRSAVETAGRACTGDLHWCAGHQPPSALQQGLAVGSCEADSCPFCCARAEAAGLQPMLARGALLRLTCLRSCGQRCLNAAS